MELEALPFTLNQHYLSDYKEKFLAHFKAAREEDIRGGVTKHVQAFKASDPVDGNEECGVPKVLSGLTEMGITGTQPEDIYKILPGDKMFPAINIMANVRAYFQGMHPCRD